ncbi:MAG: glycosyltransferase [Brasilonema octagenarum HA4186-MV1]|uniref:Beta-monoglucosyldiacylglycerol synthase n=1 Tax=Brasilonema sennae CENA114 TaxID=415709 RepID=A0A856MJB3_9CYAN|nr:glycosyltransferase family 2 protein [Brasilonema sennae]MBW4625764.1 glycosyltransferase [Brasilonema octagenarum HA4186-MV1]QDL11393.1 glycosyltransferase family 2 protein [Brasilonema sennae CENA114]QDL17735.1 glycosyltransferase family 2 protein [Brasilonema octagenarum UFV-E1]QDL17784.1 glycosyltransferase family 2 protein [Brasilonema octagenarum UFV-E1]
MPANSWPENDSYNELDPLNSLLSDLSGSEELEEETSVSVFPPSRFQGRRRKAALVLTIVWSGTIALHLVSWGSLFVLGLTTIIGFHAFVVVFARSKPHPEEMQGDLPSVSVLVAAKNEEAVIGRLVKNLCNLDYPEGEYEVWIIDDNSSDRTPQLLSELAQEYDQLKVLRRKPEAGGGKSGALNQVLALTKGEILAVFDADAQVSPDMLQRVIPLFQRENVGAVQVRKAIANAKENFWTKGQASEMAFDTFLQHQRSTNGGIGELRGNGQFVRRKALLCGGGWNEETITDDLDLTLRLHLEKWEVKCVFNPTVEEEGVTNAIALWHQRNRWAEGGYQRYLDYWDLILRNRMGTRKTWDLFVFMLIQYILPTAAVPDLLMAIARHRPPIFSPVTGLTVTMSMAGMFAGLRRIRQDNKFQISTYFLLLLQALRGTFYMLHWIVVISSTTARMSVRPKRLKWVKTVHQGKDEE